MATTPYKNKLLLFNDGEGVAEDDWNDLQKLLTFRAWDAIGQYSKGAASQGHPLAASATFKDRFTTPGTWGGVTGGPTFCFGADFAFTGKTTTDLTINPGFIGRNGKTTRAANVPSMEWVYVDDDTGTPTFTVDVNAGGGDRYDALSIAFTETDEETESRDFKDGTTGALSTTTPAKARNIVATITLTAGTEGGAIAVIPAGEHLLCYVKVLSSTSIIDEIFDYTIPINNISVEQSSPAIQAIWTDMGGAGSADWVRQGGGTIAAGVSGPRNLYLHPPSHSNPHARILAIELSYKLNAASTVVLVSGAFAGSGALEVVLGIDISSLLTRDDTLNKTVIELTNPNLLLVAPLEGKAPLWCNGLHHKTDQVNPAGVTPDLPNQGWFLQIDSTAGVDVIFGVSWTIAK